MKRSLLYLVVLALILLPVSTQAHPGGPKAIKFRVSGTATILGDPFAGSFTFMPLLTGWGSYGGALLQGVYQYQMLNQAGGSTTCDVGQFAVRVDAKGDLLLAVVTPGVTGTLTSTGATSYAWTQTVKGTIAGGTGRFAGATGTFTQTLTGFLVAPGFVSPWQGKIEILLDRK
jgi:hypothetical protein